MTTRILALELLKKARNLIYIKELKSNISTIISTTAKNFKTSWG